MTSAQTMTIQMKILTKYPIENLFLEMNYVTFHVQNRLYNELLRGVAGPGIGQELLMHHVVGQLEDEYEYC
jgi:hypothetical protein